MQNKCYTFIIVSLSHPETHLQKDMIILNIQLPHSFLTTAPPRELCPAQTSAYCPSPMLHCAAGNLALQPLSSHCRDTRLAKLAFCPPLSAPRSTHAPEHKVPGRTLHKGCPHLLLRTFQEPASERAGCRGSRRSLLPPRPSAF